VRAEETEQLSPLPDFPIWRLAVFLFCFYAASGFLVSLIPIVFARTEQVTDWIRVFSSLGAALVFRFYPRSDLRNFYRGAFPFIAAALFFLTFSPYRTPARVFLEGGLSFLDLYAWLLLIYFASRTGLRRGAVINLGISIIVLAGTVSHFSILFRSSAFLFPGQSNQVSFALLGIFLLLLLLSLWDGRELPLQMGSAARREPEEGGVAGSDDGGDMGDADPEQKEKEEEMGRRMKLIKFNLTRQETEIALLLLKGAKDLNICSLLYISQNTLKYHLRNIYRKTGSGNRRELKNILD
jgi:DNA-binding CsgD family transcriptional regulator